MSVAEIRRQKAQTKREADRARRAHDRARLVELRHLIAMARITKRARIRQVRELCRAARERLKERARGLRAELRRIPETRRGARAQCTADRLEAREGGTAAIVAAKGELVDERLTQRLVRTAEGRARARGPTALEERQESDDEVRRNLPHELVPVWEVKRRDPAIRASLRRSRTEAFLEWVAEHEGDVWAILEAQTARDLEALIREERTMGRAIRARRRVEPEAAGAIPF